MEQSIKATGPRIKLTEKELFGMLKVTFTKAISKMIRLTGTVSISTSTAADMKATGRKTCKKARAKRCGATGQSTKALTPKEESTATALTNGSTAQSTMESGWRIELKASEFMSGLTAEDTKENGSTTTWKAKAFTPGKMAGSMRESTKMIKRTGMELTTGLTDGNTLACGATANKVVRVPIDQLTARLERAFGRTESVSSGSRAQWDSFASYNRRMTF